MNYQSNLLMGQERTCLSTNHNYQFPSVMFLKRAVSIFNLQVNVFSNILISIPVSACCFMFCNIALNEATGHTGSGQ